MVNALDEATRLKMDCVQVFTKNQRQWRAKPLSDTERTAWLSRLDDLGWDATLNTDEPARIVSHNSYLINMASPDSEAWEKSVKLQRVELERCEELHIPFCVAHPGAHMGTAPKTGTPHELHREPKRDERNGLKRIVKALNRLHRELKGYRAITCIETTTGSGSNLGFDFQHLAWIRDNVKAPERVGFCFDTCHVTAAGYDMHTDNNAREVIEEFDEVCGLQSLHVFHLNDSVGEVASRKDRHAHIGDGTCGKACFRTIVNDSRFDNVPKILETPKGDNEKGIPWDTVNLRRLRRMIRRKQRST